VKETIHDWREKHLSKHKTRKWDENRLHVTLMYCGDDLEYSYKELCKMLKCVDYKPTVRFKRFRKGDFGNVYFIALEEVVSDDKNLNQVFRKMYKIATSCERKIEMRGHDKGKHYPDPLHITIFYTGTDGVVDPKDIEIADSALFEILADDACEFSLPSLRVMSDNPITGKSYIICEKRLK